MGNFYQFVNRGKNFRNSFEKIGSLRAFTDVPIMALTVSAPANVEDVIVRSLHLDSPVFVRGDVDRPNIYFSVSVIKSLSVSLLAIKLCVAVNL